MEYLGASIILRTPDSVGVGVLIRIALVLLLVGVYLVWSQSEKGQGKLCRITFNGRRSLSSPSPFTPSLLVEMDGDKFHLPPLPPFSKVTLYPCTVLCS